MVHAFITDLLATEFKRTSVAKNLKGSGRQILLKFPEVDNTLSDKIGGEGGGEKRVPPSSSLFICDERIWCFVHWPLVIGHWQLVIGHLIIHNEPTLMICLSDQLTKTFFSTQLPNAQSNLH